MANYANRHGGAREQKSHQRIGGPCNKPNGLCHDTDVTKDVKSSNVAALACVTRLTFGMLPCAAEGPLASGEPRPVCCRVLHFPCLHLTAVWAQDPGLALAGLRFWALSDVSYQLHPGRAVPTGEQYRQRLCQSRCAILHVNALLPLPTVVGT